MNPRRGLSLIETLLAIFVLMVVFILFASLFQWVLSSSRRGDEAATAGRLASNRLAELRQWAAQAAGPSDNFRSGDWASLSAPVEAEPGYQTSVTRIAASCYAPCTQLESLFSQPRTMSNSCVRVRVRVQWGSNSYDLYSQVTAPPVAPHQPYDSNIQISQSSSGTLASGASRELTAQALDANNQPIQDLVYQWNVLPESGTGSLLDMDRNGSRVQFTNDNPLTTNGSTLKVAVQATYRGILLQGVSTTITVDGP
jgi:Tfp pilus assembly protein PilV